MNAAEIRKTFQLNSANSKRSQTEWQAIFNPDVMDIRMRSGSVTFQVRQSVYGIAWAVQTGRLTATVEMNLRSMGAYKFAKLLADVSANCATMADVPAYLNK